MYSPFWLLASPTAYKRAAVRQFIDFAIPRLSVSIKEHNVWNGDARS